ncbi:MAG TPA: cysteine hydrolase [Methanocorpusculum sp.]|nr:cysteine hydrolase [Methanocorpusculum sp.]
MTRLLVVTDFQYDFVCGSLGFPKALELEKPIAEKIAAYRASGDEIVFTLDTHDSDYLNTQEGRKLPVLHCIKGTKGHKLYGKIAEMCLPTDKVFEKHGFPCPKFYDYLKGKTYEAVEFVGLVSSICVISNAILAKAALPETEIVVDAQCTSTFDESLNKKALDVMDNLQITVVNRNDL